MALGSGLASSIGFKTQTTAGVPVTVDRWVPLVSETVKQTIERLESKAVISGRRLLASQQWVAGNVMVDGTVTMELYNLSIGAFLTWIYGTVGTTGPSGGLYTHTFTPGDLSDDFFTMQIGRPDVGGTVRPFTYDTVMIDSATISAEAGGIVDFSVDVIGRSEIRYRTVADAVTNTDTSLTSATAAFVQDDVGKPISGTGIPAATTIASVTNATTVVLSAATTATASGVTIVIGLALTAVSYSSGIAPMTYAGSTVTVAGVSQNVKKLERKFSNGLDKERRFLGSQYIAQPKEADLRDWGGTLELEFESMTNYHRYAYGTEAALVSRFASGNQVLTITDNVRFDGETPNDTGRGITQLSQPFKVIGTTTDALGSTATWVTSEATP